MRWICQNRETEAGWDERIKVFYGGYDRQFESILSGKSRMAKNPPKGKKNQGTGKIYRQFTRVKFEKYKLQFPRLRESEIITKIIRQWEAMDEEAKENLGKQFIERSGMGFLEEDSSSSKKRREAAEKEAAEKQAAEEEAALPTTTKKKGKKTSPKVRVFEEKKPKGLPDVDDSDFKRSDEDGKKSGKKSTPEKSSESFVIHGKTQLIKKTKVEAQSRKQQYITFFKYYYERLSAEHARWTKAQITTIIKLLWRKRNKTGKRGREVSSKGLSGRQLYRRTKESEGFLRDQIKSMWSSLPHESKKYWHIKAKGKPTRAKKSTGWHLRRVLNAGSRIEPSSQTEPSKDLSWMDQQIN